jgi:3-methylfumaryl-CoA hydratase
VSPGAQGLTSTDGAALEDERRTGADLQQSSHPYPGLVVHGPLTTTLLIDFARDQNPGRRIAAYTTQARAPLFDTAPFELRGRPTAPGRCELWAVTPEGTVAMSAEVELA